MGWKTTGLVGLLAMATSACAQAGLSSGTDPESGIAWAFVSVDGRVVAGEQGEHPPRLTAQCTKDAKCKLKFELLADVGDVPEVRFVPPFKPRGTQLFPPDLPKAIVTMEFRGYVKVKPVKRQWVGIDGLAGEWKYATPGGHSSNMEEVMFYLQYLKALPTLRLTLPSASGSGKPVVAEFETASWQAKVRAEPLCWASAL